jgi:phosphoribosylanthranilate isomerase
MWVKICGVRDVVTARDVADLGPDAIGLNFHPESPRYVDFRTAERIVRALPVNVEPIGVFVNREPDDILEIALPLRMTTVQLHGDEPVEVAAGLIRSGLQVIRAIRIDEANADSLPETVAAYAGMPLRAVLVDARVSGVYGGTGRPAPWELIARVLQPSWPPLILAGGLTPDNVAAAIEVTHAWGVDTASGVETSPGVKDLELTRKFIAAAREG